MVDIKTNGLLWKNNILTAEVVAAVKLDETMLIQLKKQLMEMMGQPVTPLITVDPKLLGGMTIKVGDRMIDGSLRSKLNNLRTVIEEHESPVKQMGEAAKSTEWPGAVEVTTAVAISDKLLEVIKTRLTETMRHPVMIRLTVDPSIVGGMLIKVDGQIVDGSLRSKLLEMKEELGGIRIK